MSADHLATPSDRRWAALKKELELDATDEGKMMSLAEWVHTTANAKRYLELMEQLERDES